MRTASIFLIISLMAIGLSSCNLKPNPKELETKIESPVIIEKVGQTWLALQTSNPLSLNNPGGKILSLVLSQEKDGTYYYYWSIVNKSGRMTKLGNTLNENRLPSGVAYAVIDTLKSVAAAASEKAPLNEKNEAFPNYFSRAANIAYLNPGVPYKISQDFSYEFLSQNFWTKAKYQLRNSYAIYYPENREISVFYLSAEQGPEKNLAFIIILLINLAIILWILLEDYGIYSDNRLGSAIFMFIVIVFISFILLNSFNLFWGNILEQSVTTKTMTMFLVSLLIGAGSLPATILRPKKAIILARDRHLSPNGIMAVAQLTLGFCWLSLFIIWDPLTILPLIGSTLLALLIWFLLSSSFWKMSGRITSRLKDKLKIRQSLA